MKKAIILFLTLFLLTSCIGQEKETIYLLFEEGAKGNCNYSMFRDGSDLKTSTFIYKKNITEKNVIRFEICTQFFVFDPKVQLKKIVPIEGLKIIDIDYLTNKLHKQGMKFDKKKEFKQIYILEKINEQEYLQYEVLWKDLYINRN